MDTSPLSESREFYGDPTMFDQPESSQSELVAQSDITSDMYETVAQFADKVLPIPPIDGQNKRSSFFPVPLYHIEQEIRDTSVVLRVWNVSAPEKYTTSPIIELFLPRTDPEISPELVIGARIKSVTSNASRVTMFLE